MRFGLLIVFSVQLFIIEATAQFRLLGGATAAVFNEPVANDKFIPSIGGGLSLLLRSNEKRRMVPLVEASFLNGAFVDRYMKSSRMWSLAGGAGVRIGQWGVFGAGLGVAALRTSAQVQLSEFYSLPKTHAEWTSLYWQASWFTNRESRWQYGASVSKSIYGLVNFSQVTFSVRYRLNKDGGGE